MGVAIFEGARDLLEISETLDAAIAAAKRRRKWRRIAEAAIIAGIFAQALAAWVATP